MMKTLKRSSCALLWLSLAACCGAAEPWSFCVMGDVPYLPAEDVLLPKQLAELPTAAKFVVHLGDIKTGQTPCDEATYVKVAGMLAKSPLPTFIIPGDNEWNDCQQPDKAWILWRRHFLKLDEHWKHGWPVERQSAREENFAFLHGGALLVGVNLVGGRILDPEEWRARHATNLSWLKTCLTKHGGQATHLVLFGHAKPQEVHKDFFAGFEQAVGEFAKPALYLHGDGHRWIHDRPFAAKNVLRVQVDQGGHAPPLLVTLTDDPLEPFRLDRRNGMGVDDGPAKPPVLKQ